jgi:geranylgeranyl pyrophosphate synthase
MLDPTAVPRAASAPATYDAGFVDEMGTSLAGHYLGWFPFCRDAVLSTVDSFADSDRLCRYLGLQADQLDRARLTEGWLRPFRSYLTRSGKFVRPYLVCLCMEGYGRDPRTLPSMVALAEVIHSSSLILDDIADDSLLRRGGPTAHQQVGVRVAGATGAAWMNLGFELLGTPVVDQLFRAMAWEHFVTGLGTTIDVTWPWKGSTRHAPEEYLQEVIHRSTSYTYRLPMKIGGWVGGASASEVAKLASFGEQLGLAFQLMDDILNVAPRDAHWGKEVAEDVAQGKITLQVLLALERGTDAQRSRLLQVLAARTHDPHPLMAAVDILRATGALDDCRRQAEAMAAECVAIAHSLEMKPEHRERLAQFADYIVKRGR